MIRENQWMLGDKSVILGTTSVEGRGIDKDNNNNYKVNHHWKEEISNGMKWKTEKGISNLIPLSSQEIRIRKYKDIDMDMDKGREFFKSRIINNKVDEHVNTFQCNDTLKETRELNTIYHKTVETAISSFNWEKYDECFNTLLRYRIIHNPDEFGEFLWVVPGFKRHIICGFLTTNQGLNMDLIIMKSFIKCMDFRGSEFLAALCYWLGKIDIPKDEVSALVIIDIFSTAFLEDNQDKGNIYKNTHSLTLLAATIWTLNTMLMRTVPGNIMTKEEFIALNQDVDNNILTSTYQDLLLNTIDTNNNFSATLYQRWTQKIFINNEIEGIKNRSCTTTNEMNRDRCRGYRERDLNLSPAQQDNSWNVITKKDKDLLTNRDRFETFGHCHSKKSQNRKSKNWNWNWIVELVHSIWKKEIIPNWSKYHFFLHYKGLCLDNKGIDKSKPKSRRNITVSNTLYLILKKIDEITKLSPSTCDSEKENDNTLHLSWNEFNYVYHLGIPEQLRCKLWRIILGNVGGIEETWFNHYLKTFKNYLTSIHFNPCFAVFYIQNHQNNQTKFTEENLFLNQAITDVIKAKDRYNDEILKKNMNQIIAMTDWFNMINVFLLYRPDIKHSRTLAYISMICYLNSDNVYSAFIMLVNIIVPTFLLQVYVNNDDFIKCRTAFFGSWLSEYHPQLHSFLVKLDVDPTRYFMKWFESLFVKVFQYKMLTRLWDVIFLKGEVEMFKIGLALITLQMEDFGNWSISEVLIKLNKTAVEVEKEECFFGMLEGIDINARYEKWKKENELAEEKCLLYEIFMNEE